MVLLDEIDKADPDVPNDLLVSLGSQRFRVEDLAREVSASNRLLVFITSNNERFTSRSLSTAMCHSQLWERPNRSGL